MSKKITETRLVTTLAADNLLTGVDLSTGVLSDQNVRITKSNALKEYLQSANPLVRAAARETGGITSNSMTTPINGGAYEFTLPDSTSIVTWTAVPANATANYEDSCSVRLKPPTTGTTDVVIPGAWAAMGELAGITLASTDNPITVILISRVDGTIEWYGCAEK